MNDQPPEDHPDVRRPPALYPVLGMGAGYLLQRYLPLPLPTLPVFQVAAWVLFTAGILLIVWSLITLRKFNTTAIAHLASRCLVTSGSYGFSRNPVYLAFLLLMLASALGVGNAWILIACPIVMILLSRYAIHPEENHLQKRFGDQYANYQRRVRRWF